MRPSGALAAAARPVGRAAIRSVSARWEPFSRLFLVAQLGDWVLADEMREVGALARSFGIRVGRASWAPHVERQCVFHSSQFVLLAGPWRPTRNRLGVAYFHGRPGTPGMPELDACYAGLRAHHGELARVQVSHSEMRDLVLEAGTDPAKVFTIPIGIDPERFPLATEASRRAVRAELELPESAFVVGSMHKDGVGWGAGARPKLVKGPDVLVEALARARERIPELIALLTGPSRGYVKRELDRRGVPYRHLLIDRPEDVARIYHALDAYLIPSRQEGGPKGLLEAMSSGVPVVTTRVGQAMDLVRHGENAFMVDVEDAEGLAHWLTHVHGGGEPMQAAGRKTAEENGYAAQAPLWREFLRGFVEFRP